MGIPIRLPPLPELPRWLVVGFSGHRHLHGRDEAVRAMVRDRLDALARRCPRLAGVCSAASGADTVFAEEMLARDGDVSVVLPFGVDRFARDFAAEPATAWPRAQAVIRRARQRDVVHQLDADLGDPADGGRPDGDALAYHEATARTVERCDVLLAVWDGRPGAGVGGTASAVEYADRLGKPVVICHPQTGAVRHLNADALDRECPAPDPATAAADGPVDLSDLRHRVQAHAAAVDAAAVRHASGARGTTKRYIYLHLTAATFGAVTLSFGLFQTVQWIPALIELLVLCRVLVLMNRRGTHYRQWLPMRVRAEVCRTFLATWDVRRHPTLVHQPRPALPGQPDLFRRLRVLRQADRSPIVTDLEAVRATYLRDRLDDQANHYQSKLAAAGQSLLWYERVFRLGSWGSTAMTVGVFGLLVSRGESRVPGVTHWAEFFAAVLPLAVTAANVLMINQEASRRSRVYGRMGQDLARARTAVAAAPTWDALERAVTDAEELLLQELIEWQSFVENTEHVH